MSHFIGFLKELGVKYLFSICLSITTIFFISPSYSKESPVLNIGFGSCAKQENPQPIWQAIAAKNPDLFIMMGDNVYIDSDDPKVMKDSYNMLAANPNFTKFRNETPIMATWDDHDYGSQDGGKEFSGKYDAKSAFVEFFDYPEVNLLATKDQGIFHSRELSFKGKTIRIIMLDTRWYRDKQQFTYLSYEQLKKLNLGRYQPHKDASKTVLGATQWKWLEETLAKPSDLNIIVSGFPMISGFSGWETWANFPHERKRLLALIEKYSVSNSIVLSGDIHRGEMSSLKLNDNTLYEITSSGLDAKIYPANVNENRYGEAVIRKNFGLLSIKLDEQGDLVVSGGLFDEQGQEQLNIVMNIK